MTDLSSTDQEHPITPSLELVGQWLCSEDYLSDAPTFSSMTITGSRLQNVATQAARWGADQELEACCEWLPSDLTIDGKSLRDVRRPKPPSLKEQALRHVGVIQDNWTLLGDGEHASPSLTGQITYKQLQDIRSALEALDDND